MKDQVEEGTIPSLNRSKDEILVSKEAKGGNKTATWYLRGQTSKVTKCQPTPGSILANRLKKALNPEGSKERVQVIQEGGLPISSGLKINDPFRPKACGLET